MLFVSSELGAAIEHVKDKCKIKRLSRYMNGKGNTRHPMIIKVLNDLSKEEIIEALINGYRVK